jgi:hypothetical protein
VPGRRKHAPNYGIRARFALKTSFVEGNEVVASAKRGDVGEVVSTAAVAIVG